MLQGVPTKWAKPISVSFHKQLLSTVEDTPYRNLVAKEKKYWVPLGEWPNPFFSFWLIEFLKDFIYLLLETGEGRQERNKRNISVWEMHQSVASRTPPTGDLACNPGMYREWELNHWPFDS